MKDGCPLSNQTTETKVTEYPEEERARVSALPKGATVFSLLFVCSSFSVDICEGGYG